MTLKIIGAGFGRTGTMSLKAALEELGFAPCYHMIEVMKNASHAGFWRDVIMGEEVDWHAFFSDYQATVDWPGCTYYQELMVQYPEAKVILSVRNPERWYESTHNTIYRLANSLLVRLLKLFAPHLRIMYSVVVDKVWADTFDNRFDDKEYAIAVFNRHIQEVKEHVPSERLLVYDIADGWEPLCRFLGVDEPENTPFPHLNDQVMLQRAMRWGPPVIIGVLGGLVALVFWLLVWLYR